jgi:predicted nucleic acid-binding protein
VELGVHLAASEGIRAGRLQTLRAAQSTYVALPVDEDVASAFAELVASARRAGRRPKVQDGWIAATARAHAVAV